MTATEIIQGSSEITNTDNDKFKDLILKLDDANQRNALVQQLENNKNAIKSEFSNVIKQMFNNNNLDKENNTVTINKNQISQEKCIMILQTYYALYYKGNNETITIDWKITETNKQQLTKIVEEFYPISDQDNNSTRKKAQAIIDAMKNESWNNTTNTVAEANTVAKVETKNTNSQAALKTTGETAKAATEAEIEESLRLQETAEKEAPATEAEAEKEAPATTENINSPANTATEAEKEESLRLQEVKTAEETAESKEDKLSQKLTEFQNTFNNSAKRTRKNRNSLYPYWDTEESKQKTTTIQKLCLAVLWEDKCKPVQEWWKFDDGFYGPRTRVAVEKLQKKLNGSKVEWQKIPEDKAFGPLTAAAAHEYITYSLKPKEEVATDQSQTTAPSAEGTPAQTTINWAEIITIKENQKNELQWKVNAKTATWPDNKNITFWPNETIVTTKSTTNPTVETHYVEKDGNMYKITESGNSVALVYDQQATDNAKKQTTNPEGELSAPKMQVEIWWKVATSISKETKFDVTKTKYNENWSDIQFTEDDWQFTADGNNYIVKYTTNENSEITKRDIYEITLDANKKTVASISKPQNMEYRAYNIINEGNKTAITQEMKNWTNWTIERKKDGSSITTETCNERGLDSETPLTVKTTMKDQNETSPLQSTVLKIKNISVLSNLTTVLQKLRLQERIQGR
jgi:hypothetical protein